MEVLKSKKIKVVTTRCKKCERPLELTVTWIEVGTDYASRGVYCSRDFESIPMPELEKLPKIVTTK